VDGGLTGVVRTSSVVGTEVGVGKVDLSPPNTGDDAPTTVIAEADLPYNPWMLRLLGPLRSGFRLLNRWLAVPDRGDRRVRLCLPMVPERPGRPQVEVALPGAVLAGRAEEITDPMIRRRAFRAVAAALRVVGRVTLGNVEQADDARVDQLADSFPLLAVTPTGVLPGPYEPGGTFWRIPLTATVAGGAILLLGRGHARASRKQLAR
jgi:hypothetical protein